MLRGPSFMPASSSPRTRPPPDHTPAPAYPADGAPRSPHRTPACFVAYLLAPFALCDRARHRTRLARGRGARALASCPPRRVRHKSRTTHATTAPGVTALAANVPATTTYIEPRRAPAAPARAAPALRRSRRNFPTGASSRYRHCRTNAGIALVSLRAALIRFRMRGASSPLQTVALADRPTCRCVVLSSAR
jgi:hypothetical protein